MATSAEPTLSLAGASIVINATETSPTAGLASRELQRYLHLLTKVESPIVQQAPGRGVAVLLTTSADRAAQFGAPIDAAALGRDGFRLRVASDGAATRVVLAAAEPVGLLYGVYTLLEELGMGFYLGGDTFPDSDDPAAGHLKADLDRTCNPVFSTRGNMLHYNFLAGCTTWGLDDYRFYFDQMAKSRCNLLLMHWYDGEPGAAYEIDGQYLAGQRAPSSLSKPWGALAALRTSEFYFDTGAFFEAEFFSSPPAQEAVDTLDEIRRSEAMFAEATRYGQRLGIQVAAGFEAPRGEPTDPVIEQRFRARVRQFLHRNPDLTYFALWEHESGGCVGTPVPAPGTPAYALYQQREADYAYLGNSPRIWEAIRYGRFAQIAYEVMHAEAPHLKLVLVGWGGDRWMQFADYCLAYDKLLPGDVVFTCHDNIDASFGPNVSTPWGQLPPSRQRWAMPWVEGDINDCWTRQPQVESVGVLAPDALQKGCQGLLTLHWRTRDVEEEVGFIAQFAWDPTLTPERYYRVMARQMFGPQQEESMGRVLGTLQKLGSRWTGVYGTSECGAMRWTTWNPHIPFEVDGSAAAHLRDQATQARDALAEVPQGQGNTEAGMFHMREGQDAAGRDVQTDPNRPGVREYDLAVQQLDALTREADPQRIRREFRRIEDTLYQLRPRLIHFGIAPKCYMPMDEFLIRLHHLARHGGVSEHTPVLRDLRRQLDQLRQDLIQRGKVPRLERLDYLCATMDFVMSFDQAAMLMADDELVECALRDADAAKKRNDTEAAARMAGQAYSKLIEAGMHNAIAALTRKLTTRCDFGVLTTVNVKAMPRYWETIGRLEDLLIAPPPRHLHARAAGAEVMLEWSSSGQTTGYHLYRRSEQDAAWMRVNAAAFEPATSLFVDRPTRAGTYLYSIAALDAAGHEGPRSHPAKVTVGPDHPLRIVASKPPAVTLAGQAVECQVIVVGDNEVREVQLHYRAGADGSWQSTPMHRRFRNAWASAIPAQAVQPGVLHFYIQATTRQGVVTTWPQTVTDGLPWSMSVVDA